MTKITTAHTDKSHQVNQAKPVNANNSKKSTTTVPIGENSSSQTQNRLLKPVFNDSIQTSILNIQEALGLNYYNLTLSNDNHSMLRKSQTNLIDLIKYYDGDPEYYYEAYTAVYSDTFGKKTTGFGHYYPKKSIKTQEEAYKTLASDLKEANKILRDKIGKDRYDKLPLSIREALVDLAFNKGPNKLNEKPELMSAIKNNDYSKIVANLYYLTSGSNGADKSKEEAGLYRRSLSRAILAIRDLSGKELEEAKKEIDKFYKKARNFYVKKAPNKSIEDLDNVYKCYKNEPLNITIKNSDNFKITVEEGKTLYSTANEAYNAQNDSSVSMQEYREAFYKINKNPSGLKAGEELIAPAVKNVKSILGEVEAVENEILNDSTQKSDTISISNHQDSITNETSEEKDLIQDNEFETNNEISQKTNCYLKEEILSGAIGACLGFLTGVAKKVHISKLAGSAVLGAGIGIGILKFIKSIFGKKEETFKFEETPKTAFQQMLQNPDTKIVSDGDFEVVTLEHEVEKGNTVYGLSKMYQISQNIFCENNQLDNPNLIKIGQKLKIEKLGYRVKGDENISKISEKLGLSEEILRDINEMEEDEDVKEEQIIELPGFTHTVVQGETLYCISKKVGVSVEKLKELNKLTSDIIHPGDKIKVIFNNSDYDIPDSMKKEVIDEETNTKVEITDVSQKYKKDFERDDILPEVREILKEKRRINGKVVANRKVFTAKDLKVEVKSDKLKGKTIILNAGHGYSSSGNIDRGALARCDMNDEWLVNANNAIRLAKELCANGAKVIYLQGKKSLITADVKKPENKADMFISIHANSASPTAKDRTMFFYRDKDASGSPKRNSIKFAGIAEKIFDKWIKNNETFADDRDKFFLNGKQDYAQISTNDERTGVLKAPLNNQNIPAILWEVAFMTATKGQERLNNPDLMNDYASLMSKAVIEYFKN